MSWKKAISLMLCLFLLASPAVPAMAAEDGAVPISSVEDLALLGQDTGGSYYLTCDLDMAGVDWTPIAFQGKLDGNGHTIYNLRVTAVGGDRADSVDGNHNAYDTAYAGLFSTLTNARVSNLTLQGVDIDIATREHCFIGAIAGYIKGTEISGCSVLDARLRLTVNCETDDVGLNPKGVYRANVGVGGIAGFGSGFVSNCTVDVTMVFDDQCGDGLRTEEFMGGILSCGNVAIEDCAVKLQGYDACHGYVHNGGLVGMYYLYDRSESARPILRNSVEGQITFYENNPDRRAYCEAFVGELLSGTNMAENSQQFQRNELFDYTRKLDPEQCEEPQLTEDIHPAGCEEIGYTVHTCAVCGNTWRDNFVLEVHQPGEWQVSQAATTETAGVRIRVCTLCGKVVAEETIPPHVPGDWILIREPDYGVTGLRQRICVDCGEVLEEDVSPALVPVAGIALEQAVVEMTYQDSTVLQWTIYPADATNTMVNWETSDRDVVTVDTNGTLNAVGGGTATVTCTSADGFAKAECVVHVKLTMQQWIARYLLFGWVKKH